MIPTNDNNLSPALVAAQARLDELRRARGIIPTAAPEPVDLPVNQAPPAWGVRNAQRALLERRRAAGVDYRPALTAPAADPPLYNAPGGAQWSQSGQSITEPSQNGPQRLKTAAGAATVRIYPDLTALAHKARRDPECRLYLVAKSLDAAGSGWIGLPALRSILAGVYTDRRLRQVLAAGEGVFWTRNEKLDRLSLPGPGKVIAELGGGRMASRPVLVNQADLLGGIKKYRAVAVFGAFLSGRRRADNPISQPAIRDAIGIAESTQRTYYTAAGVAARRGIKLGGVATAARLEEAHWKHGRSVFKFVDWIGKHGKPRQSYIAHSIGNVYTLPDRERPSWGRYRKINAVLDSSKNPGRVKSARVYFATGGAAWRAYNRCNLERAYYAGPALVPDMARPVKLGGLAVYIAVPGDSYV